MAGGVFTVAALAVAAVCGCVAVSRGYEASQGIYTVSDTIRSSGNFRRNGEELWYYPYGGTATVKHLQTAFQS